jgi:hypothetical protein
MVRPPPILLLLVLSLSAAGCGRCSPSGEGSESGGDSASHGSRGAPPASSPLPPLLPAPKPISFSKLRGRTSVAVPEGCELRGPIVEARLPASSRFVAEPRSLGTLIVADSAGDPPALTGVAALTLDPEGEARDPKPLPWTEASSLPRLARADGGAWLAAVTRGEGSTGRVDLWRGGALDPVGEGDHFEAADLACGAGRCALLTTRLGKVAAPGAEVWIGAPTEAVSAFRRITIAPSAGESDAHPVGIAAVDPEGATSGVVAALAEKGTCAFWLADASPTDGRPREIARVPAPYGVLDAIMAPNPVALTYASAVGENGCVATGPRGDGTESGSGNESGSESEGESDRERDREGEAPEPGKEPGKEGAPGAREEPPGTRTLAAAGSAGLRFERAGLPGIEVRTPAPPTAAALRRLARGAIAVWVAPLGCGLARRVVFAVVLDEQGAPVSEVMPVADGGRFAVAAQGASVDLWMEREEALTWVPLTCGVAPK